MTTYKTSSNKIYVYRKADVKPRLTFGQSPQYWHFYQFWPHCVIFSTKMEWQWITFITFLSLNVSASAQHFSHKNDHSSYFLRKCEKIHRCLAGILKCRSFKLRTAKSCQCFSQSPPRFIIHVCLCLTKHDAEHRNLSTKLRCWLSKNENLIFFSCLLCWSLVESRPSP